MIERADFRNVSISGGFWKEKQELIKRVTIPYIWRALNDDIDGIVRSGAVNNFKIAAGKKRGDFFGLVSQDSDLFKWMEAAAYALVLEDSKEIEENLEQAVMLLEDAQQKDGYLNSYYILNGLSQRWSYLKESCQLYCAGHLIEAAVAHYEVSGKRNLLDIACRYADCIDRSFGKEKGKIRGYDGHAEVELALFKLYECTGEERYRKLGMFFVEERGQKPFFFEMEKRNQKIQENLVYELQEADFSHSQSHLPIRRQKEAKGHAVKAMYFYSAAADMARLEQDEELYRSLRELWEDVTQRKMYLTGAIGSRECGESFSYAYDLPLDLMYGETCASVGLLLWAGRMMLLKEDSCYADVMETALYNGILCGISQSVDRFFYTNVLEMDPEKCGLRPEYAHVMKERQPWFACPCCPANIARTILSVQNYIYTFSDEQLCIHQYMCSDLKENGWQCSQRTDYPYDGEIFIKVQSERDSAVKLRIPGWCEKYMVQKNGEYYSVQREKGYVKIFVEKGSVHEITLRLCMKPEKIYAKAEAESMQGKAAVICGPLVYCAEETDNPLLSRCCLKQGGYLKKEQNAILAEGSSYRNEMDGLYGKQRFSLQSCEIRMIPYFQWNNRGAGRIKTFFEER